MRIRTCSFAGLLVLVSVCAVERVGAQEAYRLPPADVVAIVDAPATPRVSLSPTGDRLLLQHRGELPTLADLSRPMLRLAGLRIDPLTRDRFRTSWTTRLEVVDVESGEGRPIRLDGDGADRLGNASWSPDATRIVFTRALDGGAELWVADAATGAAKRLTDARLNGVLFGSMSFFGGPDRLLVKLVPTGAGRTGGPPAPPAVPTGPLVQETAGRVAMNRTYQDLLQTPYDDELFAYHATSQLAVVDLDGGGVETVGGPGLYLGVSGAPDGSHILVTRLERPFSRAVPAYSFARTIEIWGPDGTVVRTIAELPVSDEIPIGGVATGPRSVEWIPTEPATLSWVEALDGGDPNTEATHRDRLLTSASPFDAPVEVARVSGRYGGAEWTERRGVVLLSDYDRDRRWTTTRLIDWLDSDVPARIVDDRSRNDRYGDPGSPVTRLLPHGARVARVDDGALWLDGSGAGPDGERPFLRRLDLATLELTEIFRSPLERHTSFVDFTATGAVFRLESATSPPNWFVATRSGEQMRRLTSFEDPHPQLTGIRKEVLRYERADGVPLSGTLYLPANHEEGTRLPLVVWAYPREYNDTKTAGQVRVTTNRFTRLSALSPLMFLTQGYAVLDGAAMPIVGDPESMNDTFAEQIVMAARAAIDACVERGVADRDQVGVGGHSYGAFMTANLLIHCDLFKAGIARSGAYNRSLTPFGFQSERRTIWEATDTYVKVSPFFQADQLDEPILLLHGEVDNNSGTFPLQSKRMFHALQGLGGTSRYVVLPHESHGYRARESVLHVLAEQFDWFGRHLKGEEPGT